MSQDDSQGCWRNIGALFTCPSREYFRRRLLEETGVKNIVAVYSQLSPHSVKNQLEISVNKCQYIYTASIISHPPNWIHATPVREPAIYSTLYLYMTANVRATSRSSLAQLNMALSDSNTVREGKGQTCAE